MLLLVSALVIAAAVTLAGLRIAGELSACRAHATRGRVLKIMALFAHGIGAAAADPRALLIWQPLAATARKMFPEELASIDVAAGVTFPFSHDQLQAAHDRWTAEWLAWERTHDADFKLKAAAAENDLLASGGAPLMRARLEAVEREKLELYQRRYEEYVRAAKGLQALMRPSS